MMQPRQGLLMLHQRGHVRVAQGQLLFGPVLPSTSVIRSDDHPRLV